MKKAAIIGLGLIGGSFGLALKKYLPGCRVYGYDINQENLEFSLQNGLIDEILKNDILKEIEIVFIAVPVRATLKVIASIYPFLQTDKTIITDMGSTKSYLCQEIKKKYPDLTFVGGHPMAGKETVGPTDAEAELFKNKSYLLVDDSEKWALEKVKEVMMLIGCRVKILTAREHDRLVALTSHLPKVNATCLMNLLLTSREESANIEALIGTGFLDMSRIAGSNPEMWLDIFLTNKENILNSIDLLLAELKNFRHLITSDKRKDIEKLMIKTEQKRNNLNRGDESGYENKQSK